MTALLTDNLPLLAGAPNGVKKLRELILELAVRGKLVLQDPSDEPASNLLKRIAEEKARLVAEGKIKKQKSLPEISDEEEPFELPAGWMWTRLGEICLTQTGTTPSKSQPELFGSDVPFIKPGDIYPDQVDYNGESLSSLGASQSGRVAQAGSLLMVCIGTIGKCNLIDRDCSFNQQINSATLYEGIPQYLKIAARSPYFQANAWSESSSTTIAILNKGKWEAIPLPLPGIAEQHRIVAKVDELMVLCDHLEAQQADAECAHARLVQTLLDSLNQACDANDFAVSWQRLAEHFHTLFTTESSIDALKQTLLQLAVMGRLVPQNTCDEPARELLKRVAEEKSRLIKECRLKKQKPLAEIKDEEKPFALPAGWEWVRKANVFNFLNGYAFKSEWFRPKGVRLLRNVNVSHGIANWNESARIPQELASEFDAFQLAENDVVLTLDRPIISTGLKYAVIRKCDLPCLLLQRVAKLSSYQGVVTVGYLVVWLNSRFFVDFIDPGRSNGVPHISTNQVANMPFALPPLEEQHRIVAKVDQLMAICDQLKTRLTQACQLNEQLSSTLVEQAVA